MTTVRFLSTEDLQGLATPAEYVDAVRDAYRERGDGAPAAPRTALTRADPGGLLTNYGAILPETGTMGGYTYTAGFESEDAWFVTPLFDAESGAPLALLDGASMNPLKTGATGAVGVDALARADATTLAVIGSGAQAPGQVLATTTVREFDRIRVYSPTPENREAFAATFDERLEATVEAVDSSTAAVAAADVVITATTASEPVIDGDDLPPGVHVTAMGQYHPNKRELDVATVADATYVPDLRERVTQDAGSFMAAVDAGAIDPDHVHAELGEVVAGQRPSRRDPEERTIFDSGGTAIETVAAATLLYERAVADDRGTTVPFTPASEAFDRI